MASAVDRAQNEKEERAFHAFVRAHPALASGISSWKVKEEAGAFPDVDARLNAGQEIGFELGEWLDEDQTRQGKKADRFKTDLLNAIGRPQPGNWTKSIHCVLLAPKEEPVRYDFQDRDMFREELFQLIEKTDKQWPSKRHWQSPQGYHCREFGAFPTLAKYLDKVWFIPRATGKVKREPRHAGIPWIELEGRGGSYSGEPARKALKAIISKKASRYGSSSGKRVVLLIHYGANAFHYNTPFMDLITPDFGAVAKFASEVVQSCNQTRPLPFEKVYLCNTLPSELEAAELFPQLARCNR
jgi:hypothetical protein